MLIGNKSLKNEIYLLRKEKQEIEDSIQKLKKNLTKRFNKILQRKIERINELVDKHNILLDELEKEHTLNKDDLKQIRTHIATIPDKTIQRYIKNIITLYNKSKNKDLAKYLLSLKDTKT